MSNDYKKIEKKSQNLHEKLYTKTMSPNQLNIKVITKNKKPLFAFFAGYNICKSKDAHYCDSVKKKQNLQKRGKFLKITKTGFVKTGCSKKKDHLRKRKPL